MVCAASISAVISRFNLALHLIKTKNGADSTDFFCDKLKMVEPDGIEPTTSTMPL